MPNSQGVVHGHIHNFNSVTYIHGHVHRKSSVSERPAGVLRDLAPEGAQLQAEEALDFHNGSELAQLPQVSAPVPNAPLSPPGSNSDVMNAIATDPSLCSQFKDCQHFEFMNYHNLNLFGKNKAPPASDETLVMPDKRRKLADCSCHPRVVEICCEEDHEFNGQPSASPLNEDLVLFTNNVEANRPLHQTAIPIVSNLPDLIDCDLTCASSNPEDDQLFEKLCEQCVDLDQSENHHSHNHTHNNRSACEPVPAAPSNPTSSHDHVINSSSDMKILEDLANISSMYDFPFGKHIHSHDNAINGDNINLLQTSLPGLKAENLDEQLNKAHHHHRIEVHPHPAHQGSNTQDPNFSNERNSQLPDFGTFMDYGKIHHGTSQQEFPPPDMRNHTVNFNWSFKDDDSKVNCGWNHCPQKYDSLIDLQSHILRDHISEGTTATKLPTPRTQFDCEWDNCGFEGDDMCTLINHINGKHGIAFNMKFLDKDKLEEQSEQHHMLHCDEACDGCRPCKDHNDEQDHTCRWEGCMQVFNSCEELNGHIEKVHIPRGKSSYVCGWENCGKVITQRQKLLRHLRVHTRYKPCKCPHCAKTFSTQDILQQHIRTHSGEKPYKCVHCGKGFATSSSLRIHIRTHTGEKPLECKVCGKRFNESSNLSKHMRTHERKYKCGKCKRSFDLQEQLEVHQSRCY